METTQKPFLEQVPPRFLVAKFISNLRRMEPRNIGLVLWSRSGTSYQFLDPDELPTGDSLRTPAYLQWLHYWRRRLDNGYIRDRSGRIFSHENPAFVDALVGKSKGNFILTDAGVLSADLNSSEVHEAAKELFEELVAQPPSSAKPRASDRKHQEDLRQLKLSVNETLTEAGLYQRKDFHKKFPMHCPVEGKPQFFEFDYALHAGRYPSMVFNLVPFWQLQVIHLTAFRFQNLRRVTRLRKEHCAAFVCASEDQLNEDVDTRNAIEMLDTIGTVVNTINPHAAAQRLLDLVPTSAA